MGRNSSSAGESATDDAPAAAFGSIRDRFPFKRNNSYSSTADLPRSAKTTPTAHKTSRSHFHHKRRLSLYPFKGKSRLYFCILMVIFMFPLASMVLQSSIMAGFRHGVGGDRMRWRWSVKEGLELGSSLAFVPQRRLELNGSRLDWLRSQPRIGVRPPRIGLVSDCLFTFSLIACDVV